MRLSSFFPVIALATGSLAFSDSSPWILLSSSAHQFTTNEQVQTSSVVLENTRKFLKDCPTDQYLIVAQPGLNAADLRTQEGWSLPSLHRLAMGDDRIRAKHFVREVVGPINDRGISDYIKATCASIGKRATVTELRLPSSAPAASVAGLSQNDERLANDLDTVTKSGSFTILLFSAQSEPMYEADFESPLQVHSRRSLDKADGAQSLLDDPKLDRRPLFEKYQFFTPGVFMGLLSVILLLLVLGIGIRALSSLEVSYGAFEKEMGPAAQKK